MSLRYRAMSVVVCAAVLLSCLSALSSCSTSDDGSNKAISYSLTSEPKNLDPQMASDKNSLLVIRNIFEGLTRYDSDGNIIPGVAEEWSSNDDYTEYTFKLRKDAKWSNGESVTAYDFVYAWQRALDPDTGSSVCSSLYCIKNARAINNGEMETSSLGVTVIDEYTLKVSLEYSYEEFVLQTVKAVYMPCNEEFFVSTSGHYGLDDDYIISNGPFTISTWSHDNYVRTVRNENYSGYNEVSPRVLYFGIRDSDTDYFSLLEAGTVEAAAIETENISNLEGTDYKYYTVTDTTYGFLFNVDSTAFSQVEVRRAMMACVTDAALTDSETGESLIPYGFDEADDIIPPSTHLNGQLYREIAGGGFKETYDPDTARESMNEALTNIGLSQMPSITLICPDDEEILELMYSIMDYWQTYLYIYVNIEPLDLSTLSSRISLDDYQIAFYPISPSSDDPLSTLELFTSSNSSNPANLAHEAYDALVEKASSSCSTEDVLAAMIAAEKYLNSYVVFYPIYYETQYYVTLSTVSGIYFSPFDGAADFTCCKYVE